MNLLFYAVLIPFILGAIGIFIPRRLFKSAGWLAVISSLSTIIAGVSVFPFYKTELFGGWLLFQGGTLSIFLVILTGVFALLVALYSIGHFGDKDSNSFFWVLYCWLIASSVGVFLAKNMIALIVFWGITGLILALMIWQSGNESTAKKTFIIVGGSDAVMLLGMVALGFVTGGSDLSNISIRLNQPYGWMIFLCLLTAAFTKAGAMPFHTWIPDTAKKAPIPVVAILPASLDKLLGIYLLKMIVMDWFVLDEMNFVLLMAGSFTIIAAVYMALAQHNLRRLLGYHAVSQVGYMVIGLGTGNPLGIAGGLLHMINNAIYKQCLFLGAGVIEKETGTSELEDMGGLAKKLPITFISFLICALAISGIPPLNGFISKWMIYQSLVVGGRGGSPLWVLWLVTAIFGSVLTLASFVKVIHAVFLGQRSKRKEYKKEKLKWELPSLILLPLACVLIGVFPGFLIFPLLKNIVGEFNIIGLWHPQIALAMLSLGVGVGVILYWLCKVSGYRISETYIGGEKVSDNMRVSGVDFYTTIEEIGIFNKIYSLARKGYFDIYDLIKSFVFYWIRLFKWLHSGVLNIYVLWIIVGSVVIFLTILR